VAIGTHPITSSWTIMAPYREHPFIVNSFVLTITHQIKRHLLKVLTQEIVWVNVKLYRLLNNDSNLILALDTVDKPTRQISLEFCHLS